MFSFERNWNGHDKHYFENINNSIEIIQTFCTMI